MVVLTAEMLVELMDVLKVFEKVVVSVAKVVASMVQLKVE